MLKKKELNFLRGSDIDLLIGASGRMTNSLFMAGFKFAPALPTTVIPLAVFVVQYSFFKFIFPSPA
jgi:hypothetical protein